MNRIDAGDVAMRLRMIELTARLTILNSWNMEDNG